METGRRIFIQQLMGCFMFMILPAKQNCLMINQGIITRNSPYSVKETIDRLVGFLEKNGATIYARIDQQNEVRRSGREIQPMEFILFGNPANGGLIMAANPLAALDLPLKILAWEGEDKTVKVAFNDPAYIQNRHSLNAKLAEVLNLKPLIEKALS